MSRKLTNKKDRAAATTVLAAASRPPIVVKSGFRSFVTDEVEKILIQNAFKLRIFQRGGDLVRMIDLKADVNSGGLNVTDGVQLQVLTQTYLQTVLGRLIDFKKMREDGKQRSIDCPIDIAADYLGRVGDWKLPRLTGFIEAPIMRNDGTILLRPGYDETTGLYLVGSEWPKIPDAPTRADAEAALAELLAPFDQFPWVGEADKSVFAAFLLTLIQRRLLRNAPLFVFDAPDIGMGKGLLVRCGSLIALGRNFGAHPVPPDKVEFHKELTTMLRGGGLLNSWDNLPEGQAFDSPALATALTEDPYRGRLLGMHEELCLRTNSVETLTGNNCLIKGDLPRRAVKCRIDAKREKAFERTFKIPNLEAYVLENRTRLVGAVLTILRAFEVVGRPKQELSKFGSFEDWSAKIREPLVWLGMADSYVTTANIIEEDPARERSGDVVAAWYGAFGDTGMKIREIAAEFNALSLKPELLALRERLLSVASDYKDRERFDRDRFGNWCRDNKGKVFNGLVLRRGGGKTNAGIWYVERTDELVAAEAVASALRSLFPRRLRVIKGGNTDPPESRKKKFGR